MRATRCVVSSFWRIPQADTTHSICIHSIHHRRIPHTVYLYITHSICRMRGILLRYTSCLGIGILLHPPPGGLLGDTVCAMYCVCVCVCVCLCVCVSVCLSVSWRRMHPPPGGHPMRATFGARARGGVRVCPCARLCTDKHTHVARMCGLCTDKAQRSLCALDCSCPYVPTRSLRAAYRDRRRRREGGERE